MPKKAAYKKAVLPRRRRRKVSRFLDRSRGRIDPQAGSKRISVVVTCMQVYDGERIGKL